MRFSSARLILLLAATVASPAARAQDNLTLVDISSVDPTIVIDLRYAGSNNIAHRPLYPAYMRPLVRPEVAQRLAVAQRFLHRYNYRLKIWDAYRPKSVQAQLWQASHNNDFVADPNAGAGSLHSWGLAVDATLTDTWSRDVSMPTDFDDFTPAAMWRYVGADPSIRAHLCTLQVAMRDAGFYGLRTEWWHFAIATWQKLMPPEEAKRATEAMGQRWEGTL